MRKLPRLSPTSWLTALKVFQQVFGVLLFAIQAPVLGPRAFGLVSIVLACVGFCELILSEAAADALISFRQIEAIHYDTINTVNVIVATLFGAGAYFGAERVAHAFGDAELAPLLRWMCVLPLISGLSAAPTAVTKREMQFQPLALRTMLSLIVGGVIGLILTLRGYGVWALVWQAIVGRSIATMVLWWAVPLRLRLRFSKSCLRDLMRFAGPFMVSRTLAWGGAQIPRLIFGAYWGATELGIFGLASRLLEILTEVALVPRYVVARVGLRQFAADRNGLVVSFGNALREASFIVFPLCVGGAAVVPTLFHAWLDERWYPGILPAQLMMLMCAPFVSHYCVGALLLALNKQIAEAWSSAVQAAATLIIVFFAAPLGLVPATALFATRPLLLLPLPVVLIKRCAVPPRILFTAQWPCAIGAIAMGGGVTAVRIGLEPYVKSPLLLPVLVAVGGALYVASMSLLAPGSIRDFLGRLRG